VINFARSIYDTIIQVNNHRQANHLWSAVAPCAIGNLLFSASVVRVTQAHQTVCRNDHNSESARRASSVTFVAVFAWYRGNHPNMTLCENPRMATSTSHEPPVACTATCSETEQAQVVGVDPR
jgi:hypothetical protein